MSEKPIIAIVSITIPTLASFNVGIAYIGSLIGNIAYLLSVLFLIAFVTVNVFHREKIEDLSKGKLYFICIAYLLVAPLIYLISAPLKPPSMFLISLFFLYFFLALIWTIVAEKRVFTNVCIVLFILCLLPLTFGLYVHWNHEEPISDKIDHLEHQRDYYDKTFTIYKDAGVFEGNTADNIESNIKELKNIIKEAKDDCSIANFEEARKKVNDGKNCTDYLSKKFEEADPRKVWHFQINAIDKELEYLQKRARYLKWRIESSNSPEDVLLIKRILLDISETMDKSNETWVLFRKADFENTSKSVKQIKKKIYEIEGNFKYLEEEYKVPVPGFEAIFTITVLLAVAYLLRKRK